MIRQIVVAAVASIALAVSAQSSTILTVPSCDTLRLVEASNVQLAKSGCCSHHGGVCNCDRSVGREVCCDGSYSPSCAMNTFIGTSRFSCGQVNTRHRASIAGKLIAEFKEIESGKRWVSRL